MRSSPFLWRWWPGKRYHTNLWTIVAVGFAAPTIGLLVMYQAGATSPAVLLGAAVAFGTLAALLTGVALTALFAPWYAAHKALQGYLRDRTLSHLPDDAPGEGGALLRNLQRTLESTDGLLEDRARLVETLSRDLRSRVGSVGNLVTMADAQPQTEEGRLYLSMIATSAQQQADTLGRLLARLQRSKTPTLTGTARVSHVLNDATRCVMPLAYQKDLKLEVAPALGLRAAVPAEVLRPVAENLFENAIKYSFPNGRVQVAVRQEAETLVITVRDRGLGFEPTVAEAFFDRFTAHGRPGTRGEATAGVGLYMCRQWLRPYGGTLTAHSDGPGTGATFTLTVPAEGEAPALEAAADRSSAIPSA